MTTPPDQEEERSAKEIVESALRATGLTMEQLAERLEYKSLKRAAAGEIPLPESKRRHIRDLVRLHELERASDPRFVNSDEPQRYRNPREKLKWALQAQNLTVPQLAKLTRYDGGILDNVINGSGEISEKMANAIARELPLLTVEDLLGGSEWPLVLSEDGMHGTYGAAPPFELPGRGKTRYVPLLSWAAAGAMNTLSPLDEGYQGEGYLTNIPGRVFAITISGDSMHPEIKPGATAIARRDDAPTPGGLVLVRTMDGDVLCKRYSTKDGGKVVVLTSVNPSYGPMEVAADEIAWICPVKQVTHNY